MVMVVGLSPACEITMEFKPPGLPIAPTRIAETVRLRVDTATLQALFGIVCAHLSAPLRADGIPGKNAPSARLLRAPQLLWGELPAVLGGGAHRDPQRPLP